MKKLLVTLLATASLISYPALSEDAAPAKEKPAAEAAKADAKPAESKEAAKEVDAEAAAAAAPSAKKPPADYTVIRVGGDEIKYSEAEEMWKSLFPGGTAPDFNTFDETIRQNVLRGMVSERLIYQEALKEGFDKSEEVKKRLASLEKQLIMQTFMESKSKSLVSEQALKDAYGKRIAELKDEEEIHARHILVKEEEEAKEIAKSLKKGGDFDKIAKEKSLDKGSGAQGGDLGWFTKERMVPEFADAAFKLKKGDISDPIKTNFGWHVIQVEDRRKVAVPSFEEMREELSGEVSNKAVQNYVETLLKKVDIKYFGSDGKEREFSKNFQPAKTDKK